MKININWFGRCCFLVELNNKKVLFDPYDKYCNVDIGIIDADILISSSTWHDHGHIGASPKAWIFTYPGIFENSGFIITGIKSKENRGTPNVIFNLRYGDISITNFADLGAKDDELFNKNLTLEQKAVLQSTNIAFIRPSIVGDEVTDNNIHNETALKYCNPQVIFPEHYFPESFIQEQVPDSKKADFLRPNIIVDEMIRKFNYPVDLINDFQITIDSEAFKNTRKIIKFLKLNPQAKYID